VRSLPNRLESDLELIARAGVWAYRFSISWPRNFSRRESGIVVANPVFEFYDRLVDGLAGPRETLKNPSRRSTTWDLPAVLQREHNGWAIRDPAYRFADYAELVAGAAARPRAARRDSTTSRWVQRRPSVTGGNWGTNFAPGVKDRALAMQVCPSFGLCWEPWNWP